MIYLFADQITTATIDINTYVALIVLCSKNAEMQLVKLNFHVRITYYK